MKIRLVTSTSTMAACVFGGSLTSALVTHWLTGTGWDPGSLLLGAVFGFLGWILSETLGDAIIVLIGTSFPGLVIFSFLHDEILRVLVIAFLCGFNTGKLIGGIHRKTT